MVVIFIIILIGVVLYMFLSKTNANTPVHENKQQYEIVSGEHRLMLDLMNNLDKAIQDYLTYAKTRQHSPEIIKSEIIDRVNFFCNSLAPNASEIALKLNITRTQVIEVIQAVSEDALLKYVYK